LEKFNQIYSFGVIGKKDKLVGFSGQQGHDKISHDQKGEGIHDGSSSTSVLSDTNF